MAEPTTTLANNKLWQQCTQPVWGISSWSTLYRNLWNGLPILLVHLVVVRPKVQSFCEFRSVQ